MAERLRRDVQAAKDKMQARFGPGREMKRLTSYLGEGEAVHLMAAGRYGGDAGLVVLTSGRLLFVVDGATRRSIEDFPLDRISSVQWSAGMVAGTLTIFAAGDKADIDQMNKKDGKQIVDTVRARLATQAPYAPLPDAHEQLRRLGELRDIGVLTPEEFERKKRELQSRM